MAQFSKQREGLVKGAVANDLSALVEDPDSFIHEAKAFTCAVEPGRRAAEARRSGPNGGGRRG